MYARVVTVQYQPGKLEEGFQMYRDSMVQPGNIDEGMQIIRDSVLPVARQQPGFKGAFWLSDRSTGKIMATTFGATEADMVAGETSGYYQAQIAKVAHVLTSQVMREAYEVDLLQGVSLS